MVIEEQEENTGNNADNEIKDVTKAKNVRINRFNYEVAILELLHDLLDCKQIWIKGAYRYRDPEED
ncbi:hypothetical protein [Candidatus Tisiphia endosymbiont of Parasteatoda lunata]|uniref:hypothetical protein n=1 Tax=Candidatus Tisiphia endosymbiont of Parasteatoda lunata TaxID=3066275 RepID=UPI00313D6607